VKAGSWKTAFCGAKKHTNMPEKQTPRLQTGVMMNGQNKGRHFTSGF
jgi:hypothetical protein